MHEFEDEFEETDCPYCAEIFLVVNLDSCLICGQVERACASCLEKHRATHSEGEVEAFRREMLDDPQITTRERINLELKEQIRRQADTLCKLIDDQEGLVKKYENQCRVLAEELDRRTPAS